MKSQRFVALFLLAAALFNYPLLSLFSTDVLVVGVPLLYVYLFAAWILVTILMARLAGRSSEDAHTPDR